MRCSDEKRKETEGMPVEKAKRKKENKNK